MGHSTEQLFEKRFAGRIEVAYRIQPIDGEERQFHQKRLSDALKAVMTALLKREPTQEELLGLTPIVVGTKKGES